MEAGEKAKKFFKNHWTVAEFYGGKKSWGRASERLHEVSHSS